MRKFLATSKKCFLVLCAAFLCGMIVSQVSSASSGVSPVTTISGVETSLLQGKSMLVSADVTDSSGITEVRCYFRYSDALPFTYTQMSEVKGNVYTGYLPTPAETDGSMEYFVLVVNKKGQVVVSEESSKKMSKMSTLSQTYAGTLRVYTEAEETDGIEQSYSSAVSVSLQQTSTEENYGVLAGVYSSDQLSGEIVSGYFGCFTLESDGTLVAREGYVIALEEGLLNSSKQGVSSSAGSSLVDLNGKYWYGEFYSTYDDQETKTEVQEITAVITQNAKNIVVVTTSKEGLGHRLVGKIYSGNHLLIYDDYDGEDWSTHWVAAETRYVQIADYVVSDADSYGTPLNVIELQRDSDTDPEPFLPPAIPLLLLKGN